MKNIFKKITVFLVAAVLFVGCEAINNSNKTQRGAVIGAASGAILGAILGNNVGSGGNSELGAVIGTAVGGKALEYLSYQGLFCGFAALAAVLLIFYRASFKGTREI